MIVKIFKGVWVLSLLGVLAVFMYTYASLPEQVQIFSEEGGFALSRNAIFYIMVVVLALFNSLVFVIARLYSQQDGYFKAWFYGLIVFFNLFFIVALQFLSLYNSAERFDYGSIGYIIYLSVALVVVWSCSWPIYAMISRIFSKPAI